MIKEAELQKIIQEKAFISNKNYTTHLSNRTDRWIFDFRRIFMNGKAGNLVAEIFYEKFANEYPFQIGTLEIGGVPLVTTILNKFFNNGHTDVNAFFVRKSRKKSGLCNMIEGEVMPDKKIILVDDVMNSGDSFWRQIEALESFGFKVDTVWSVLRYRDISYYKRFHNRNIKVKSLFTLDDFTSILGDNIHNLKQKKKTEPHMPFSQKWLFRSENPTLAHVVTKSQPVIDNKRIYFGADNKYFWAINQDDGSIAWKFKVSPVAKKKSIFSSPALYNNTVIFGSYDGNVYCLDAETGKPIWVSFEADWVGSSPSVATDLGIVFIGLEFGLFKKNGGIVALNAKNGEVLWMDRSHQGYTHSSPLYISEHKQVIIGSNDGFARLYDAKTGKLIWSFQTFGSDNSSLNNAGTRKGYGKGDIKEGFAYSKKYDLVMFGAIDGVFYILDRRTGHLVNYRKCEFGIFSTPCIFEDKVYFTSTDKRLRCIDLETLETNFIENIDNTRIFSTPTVINRKLYVGTNAGRLHELDLLTGKQKGYFQTAERITNSPVYNIETDMYYLPTYANEIIALKRNSDA